MAFDSLPHGELADSAIHEKKVLKNTYYCGACSRSFVSQEHVSECRFCSGAVVQLHDDLYNKFVNNLKFHYYCDFCNKDFILFHRPLACECGTPVRKSTRLDKTTLFEKLGQGFPVVEQFRERRLQSRGAVTEKSITEPHEKRRFSLRPLELPKLSFARSKEELPSD